MRLAITSVCEPLPKDQLYSQVVLCGEGNLSFNVRARLAELYGSFVLRASEFISIFTLDVITSRIEYLVIIGWREFGQDNVIGINHHVSVTKSYTNYICIPSGSTLFRDSLYTNVFYEIEGISDLGKDFVQWLQNELIGFELAQ